jgi:hypothetical protein
MSILYEIRTTLQKLNDEIIYVAEDNFGNIVTGSSLDEVTKNIDTARGNYFYYMIESLHEAFSKEEKHK